jgi:hypothetical protein
MFDPALFGYPLRANFDRSRLSRLLNHFEGEVKRDADRKLAVELRRDLLDSPTPAISQSAFERLARWCKTDGIYGEGMEVAVKISDELFGRRLDRNALRK